jgi:acetamidase/formamidase
MTSTPKCHCVPKNCLHKTWNRSEKPVVFIKPGDEVTLTAPDASNGEITRQSTTADVAQIDYRRLDPLVGPIYVEGAKPGDALEIEVLDLKILSWGWNAVLPDFGLLSDEIEGYFLKVWELDRDHIEMPNGAKFKLRPMVGCIGVAPAEDGDYATITPTNAAGNIDVRYLGVGAKLYVPIFNDGALLSAADGHAIQGDGEINGTAIECPMEMTFRVNLVKNAGLDAPELLVGDTFSAEEGYRIFTGVGPDLMVGAREAVKRAIPALARAQNISEIEAYAMMGLVGELRIHEIVDKPNWVVGCMLPRRLF